MRQLLTDLISSFVCSSGKFSTHTQFVTSSDP